MKFTQKSGSNEPKNKFTSGLNQVTSPNNQQRNIGNTLNTWQHSGIEDTGVFSSTYGTEVWLLEVVALLLCCLNLSRSPIILQKMNPDQSP